MSQRKSMESSNNGNQQQNTRESIRQLMKKRKMSKTLPENFFENILELEIKLKRDFAITTLKELIYMYSNAIEYYESVDDPRFRDYQNRLNMMLSQTDIMKKLSDVSKKEYPNGNEIVNENRDNDKFQEEKKQMKLKVNYVNQTNTFSNNEKQVKNILNDITETQNDQKLGKMVNEEIVRQNTSFQERLQKKKKDKMSKKINSMDYNNSLDSIHRKDISEYSGIRHREEEDSMHSTMNKLFPEESKEANGKELAKDKSMSKLKGKFNKKLEIIEENAQSDYQNTNTEFENNQEGFNNNTSEGLFNDNVSSGSGNIRDEDEEKDTISFKDIRKVTEKIDETISESKNLGPKHKVLFDDIKNTLGSYVSDFNYYFYQHVFARFSEQLQLLMEEKFNKYTETCRNYHSQIKEMEFLLTDDDQHRESIIMIIDSLKEEKQQEIDRMEEHYNKVIEEAMINFKTFGVKENSGIQLIEEKFKLDLFNLINDSITPNFANKK